MGIRQKLGNAIAGFNHVMAFDNRWELVLRRLLFRGTGILTYRRKGMEIIIDHHGGDEAGTRSCIVSNMYRCLIKSMALATPITLLDIGANGGGFPLMLADAGYTIKKVAAVEMNARVYARMQTNVTQNLDVESHFFNVAICGEPQTIETKMGRGSSGESIAGSSGSSSWGLTRKAVIEGITFDTLFDRAFAPGETVDLCKMDIEGSEYAIFEQGHCTKLTQCRYLIIEIHAVGGKSPDQVVKAIEAQGFVEMPRPPEGEADVYCFHNQQLVQADA